MFAFQQFRLIAVEDTELRGDSVHFLYVAGGRPALLATTAEALLRRHDVGKENLLRSHIAGIFCGSLCRVRALNGIRHILEQLLLVHFGVKCTVAPIHTKAPMPSVDQITNLFTSSLLRKTA